MQKITREEPLAFDSFESAVAHLEKIAGSRSGAMSESAKKYPALLAKYQSEIDEQIAKAAERVRWPSAPPAVGEFNALVDRIRRRDMCNGTEALRRARAEDPELFARYQAS